MSRTYPLDWWLERLEGVRPVGDGYTALCPAHDDHKNSLSLRELPDGSVVLNCFAGCNYVDILEQLEGTGPRIHINNVPEKVTTQSPREWWEQYTQIPSHFWETLGVKYDLGSVVFTWREVDSKKKRRSGTKEFSWESSGSTTPPFWPSMPETLPERIWISEGESDCGILRYLGLEAYALTKGAQSAPEILTRSASYLHHLGVKEIVYVPDIDEAGQKSLQAVSQALTGSSIELKSVDLSKLINPLLGEKDLRDLWRRVRDVTGLKSTLISLVRVIRESSSPDWISASDLLQTRLQEHPWLVERTVFTNTVGMIVGSPKMRKSWLALDLGLSIATNTPFLGQFDVIQPGPVVYISKEDPDYALQDRIAKILVSKGFGGSIRKLPNGHTTVRLPSREEVPLLTDLSRTFFFSPQQIDILLARLTKFKEQYGYISLIIFDPILRMLSDIDEFKASDINRVLFDPVSQIIREIGSSAILVHHRSKGGGDSKNSYGSVAFHAFSDSTLYVQGNEVPDDGWVHVKNEFKSSSEFSWRYNFRDLDTSYSVEVDFSNQRTNPAIPEIVEFLRKSPGRSAAEIQAKFSDMMISQVREILRSLEASGQIYREKEKTKEGRSGPRRDLWFAAPEDAENLSEIDG